MGKEDDPAIHEPAGQVRFDWIELSMFVCLFVCL
jgi:hypothetical protein